MKPSQRCVATTTQQTTMTAEAASDKDKGDNDNNNEFKRGQRGWIELCILDVDEVPNL